MSSVGSTSQSEHERKLAEAAAQKRLDSNKKQYIYLAYAIALFLFVSLITLVNLTVHRVYGVELLDYLNWYPVVMAVLWLVSFGPTIIALRLINRTLAAQENLLEIQHSKE